MTEENSPPPPLTPPEYLDEIDLEVRPPGQRVWWRTAWEDLGPNFYGRKGSGRFDSPSARFGVMYLASTQTGAIAEWLADRVVGTRHPIVAESELRERHLYRTTLPPEIERMCPTFEENLTLLKATLAEFVGSYDISQQWGRAIMNHPKDYQGIRFLGRQCGGDCLALFGDRDDPRIDFEPEGPLWDLEIAKDWLEKNGVGIE